MRPQKIQGIFIYYLKNIFMEEEDRFDEEGET